MGKKGTGHVFNMTPKRLKECLDMLNNQHTVGSIAISFGISRGTLDRKLKDLGVDANAIRNAGKLSMRAMLFESIDSIKDDNKRVDAGLKYLNTYPITDDDEQDVDTAKSDAQLRLEIISDLSGQ